jgi:hypothetical protein
MGASGGQQQMVIVSRFSGFDNEFGERLRHCDRGRRAGCDAISLIFTASRCASAASSSGCRSGADHF